MSIAPPSDYGFILTLPGYNFETATPEQCVVHSKYPSPKIKTDADPSHLGIVNVTMSSVVPINTTRNVFTLAHGYDYVPWSWCLYYSSTLEPANRAYGYMPFNAYNGGYFRAYCDDTNFYIDLVVLGLFDTTGIVGKSYTFRYYIFAEDGD